MQVIKCFEVRVKYREVSDDTEHVTVHRFTNYQAAKEFQFARKLQLGNDPRAKDSFDVKVFEDEIVLFESFDEMLSNQSNYS